MLALHIILAGVSTFWLGRAHGLRTGGAIAAGIAFAFSSLMVRRAAEFHFITTLAWLPLLLLCAKYTLDAPDWRIRLRYAAASACLFALAVLGGFTHILPHIALAVGVYGLLYRYLQFKEEGAPADGKPWMLLREDAVALVVIFGLGAILAGALIYPLTELAQYTARQKGDEVGQYSNISGQPVLKTLQDLIIYPGAQYEAEAVRGSGIIALLLAAMAFSHRKWRVTLLFFLLFYVFFDCSMGSPWPVARIFAILSPFAMSANSRAYDVALLPISIMAGIGVDALSDRMSEKWSTFARSVVLLALGALILLPFDRWLSAGVLQHCQEAAKLKLVFYIPMLALLYMGVCGTVGAPRAAQIGLPLLMFLEILAWNAHFVPRMLGGAWRLPSAQGLAVASIPQDNVRVADPEQINSLFSLRNIINGYDPLHLAKARSVISGVGRGQAYYRAVRNWECTEDTQRGNLLMKRPFWLSRQWASEKLPGKEDLFPSATTVFLDSEPNPSIPKVEAAQLPHSGVSTNAQVQEIAPPGLLNAAIPPPGRRIQIPYQLPTQVGARPVGPAGCVHSVFQITYTSTYGATLKTVFAAKEGGRKELGKMYRLPNTRGQSVVVELPVPDIAAGALLLSIETKERQGTFSLQQIRVLSDRDDEDGCIRIVERRLNSVEVELSNLAAPRVLTYLDAAYPGWHAYVDGQETPILTADEAFKAVAVPEGTHRVLFEYRPVRIYAGLGISTSGLVLLAAILWWSRERNRQTIQTALEPSPVEEGSRKSKKGHRS